MAVRSDVDWETCDEDKCVGVRLASGGRCWAHAEAPEFEAAHDQLSKDGQLDGRGVTFTAELLERLLNAAPNDDEGRPAISAALFSRATFKGDAEFIGTTFDGEAHFMGANFEGEGGASFQAAKFTNFTTFDEARFTGPAAFGGASFGGYAAFGETTFTAGAIFAGAKFQSGATFAQAHFEGFTSFMSAKFGSGAGFDRANFVDVGFEFATFSGLSATFTSATFGGSAGFPWVKFESGASFSDANFVDYVWFSDATFEGNTTFTTANFAKTAGFMGVNIGGDVSFHGAKFGEALFVDANFAGARQLGPMVGRRLVLDRALFREPIQIEVSAETLSCKRARFLAGVQLRVRWAQVALNDAELAAPSTLTGASPFPDLETDDRPDSASLIGTDGAPRLLSVSGANVAGLTVGAAVDLRACRFVDAHRLDQLRAEVSTFASTPPGWKRATRQTIAEEQQWRASKNRRGWYGPENQPPDWLEVKELTPGQAGLLPPGEIAPLYRDLRKGLEDNKDEPGAADFYYGEMEMRRHAKHPRLRGFDISAVTEWAILTLYWLVSGYGLRAWRALASLAVLALVASVIFAFWGFPEAAGWRDLRPALIHSAQATTALLRGPDPRRLTEVGEWTQIALRLIGPLLLGLAVLSVRGRVKR
jgi:uncharacterized protein YjbI with pentapeptide repeats